MPFSQLIYNQLYICMLKNHSKRYFSKGLKRKLSQPPHLKATNFKNKVKFLRSHLKNQCFHHQERGNRTTYPLETFN